MAAWCTTLSVQGAITRRKSFVESSVRGLHASFFFSVIAAAGLMTAFVGDDYSLRYVATHSSRNMEVLYKVCAFWSDSGGQWLLGSLMFAGAGSIAARQTLHDDHDRPRNAITIAAIGLVLGAALVVTVFIVDPFAPLARTASDGRGLDPVFRNPAAAIQPPLMIFGVVCCCVVFTLGSAIRRVEKTGRRVGFVTARIPRWALASWAFLSIALLLGAHWSYASPGLRSFAAGTWLVKLSVTGWVVCTILLIFMEWLRRVTHMLSAIDLRLRSVGRVVAIAGAALCLATLAARPYWKNYDAQIGDGEQYRAKDAWGHEWIFASQGASRLERQGDDVTSVALLPTRDGVRQPFIASESRQYYGPGGLDIYPAQAVPGIRSTIAQDLFVVLADAGEGSSVLRISFRPLVELAWIGGVLFALGGILLFWPPRAELSS